MRRLFIPLFAISFAYAGISPEMQAKFDASESLAKSEAQAISSKSGFNDFKISDYTNDPSAINHPAQEAYYSNPTAMQNASSNEFAKSDYAQAETKTYLNQPVVNSKSDTNQKLESVINNAQDVVNGNSTGNLECVTKGIDCHTESVTKTCTKSEASYITCYEQPQVSFNDLGIMNVNWVSTCDNNVTSQCSLSSKTCVEGPETKAIGDKKAYLACWKYNETYQCGHNSMDTCSTMQDCTVVSSKCTQSQGKFCLQRDYTYSCSTQKCDSSKILCGEPGFCTDGSCFVPTRSDTQGSDTDFAKPATELAVAAAAANNVKDQKYQDPATARKNIRIQPGDAMDCKISRTYNHCTHPSSPDEKKLYEAKKKKEVIFVGKYCSNKILGFCLGWKESYCVFKSKFAEIVQQYGKPQIRVSFGSAKHPDCRGFTIDEFQVLDFDKMDFSSLFNDTINSTNFPSKQDVIDQAKKRIDQE